MPNRLSQFWQEIKRRNVHRSLAIYAGTAFIILEAADIIFPRWGLPDWTIDLVLYLLILGAVITIIVSWIFDITSEGVEKTKPIREEEEEQRVVPHGWKIATYISIVVIIGLVTFNIVEGTRQLKAGDIQSLVILPFENFTGDDELDYFVSGLHFSLIADVGKVGKLKVISKTSADVYKNADKSVPQIAAELGTDALVEAAVMCLGNDSICMRFKLITPDENQLWVAEYVQERSQILNLYTRVTKQIAAEVMVELTAEENRLFDKDRTVDREAFDAYLKSYRYWNDFSRDSLNKALVYLNSAIEKDPDWAPLYSALADVWSGIQHFGFEPFSVTSPKIYENLNKALDLDPDLPDSHLHKAKNAHFMEWDWEKSEKEFLKALAVNPNDANARIMYAQLLLGLQRPDEALTQGQLAYELDPLNPMMKIWYGTLLPCESALTLAEELLAAIPGHAMAYSMIESAAFFCMDYDKAFEAGINWIELELKVEEDTIKKIERIYREQGFAAAYGEEVRILLEFAHTNPISPNSIAITYMYADQPDKAMVWLEKGFEIHDPQTIYITSYPHFKPLYDNPRFINLVQKMNLPLPPN